LNRTLRVKRLWSMGNYNNVELYDEIVEIPEKVALSPKATGLLYYLMILEQEKAHKKYLNLYKKFPANMEQLDQTAEIIEEERSKTFLEFIEELNRELSPDESNNA
jgi:hypothetical protein